MSSPQNNDHNNLEGEEKKENSLFQTELSNPKISSSENSENGKANNKIQQLDEVEIDTNNNEKQSDEATNKIDNHDNKIKADPIKEILNISFNNNNLKEENKNDIPDNNLPKENQFNQNNQRMDLEKINNQLAKDDECNHISSSISQKNENRAKTSNGKRSQNKRYSYLQEIKSIPDSIKCNKYILCRYELYSIPQKSVKIPKAALPKNEYHAKKASKLDDFTLKLLDGDEEAIKKIKSIRKANPNRHDTSTRKINESRKVDNKDQSIYTENNESDLNKIINEESDNNLSTKDKLINNNPDEKPNFEENRDVLNEQIVEEEENNDEEDFLTIDDLKRTAGQLREFERTMTSKGNYVDAKNATATLEMVNKEIYKQQNFSKNKGTIDQLVSKMNELKAILNSTTEEFDNMIIEHEKNTILKLDQIALQQQQELENFDKNIPKDLPPLFKRNSVSYLKMRSKEKYLALKRDFDEAMILQKKADDIEKEEEQLNFEKMDQYYRDKRKRLIIKQKNAIDAYIQYSDMRKSEILTLREASIRGTANRIKNLEHQIKIECEKKRIRQSEINYDIVDESRIELIKSFENENPISYKKTATSKLQRNSQTISSSTTSSASFKSSSQLSQRSSTANSQSSIGYRSKSALSTKKPKIKAPSSLSGSPIIKKKPKKPIKTSNDNKQIPLLNKNFINENNKAEVGVNTRHEKDDEL